MKAATIIFLLMASGALAVPVHFPLSVAAGLRFGAGAELGLAGGWLLARWFEIRKS